MRIALADDHPVLLAGMAYLLKRQPGYEVVGEVCDSTALVALLSSTPADVVITDFSMPHGRYGDGISMLGFLHRRFPQVQRVVLTGMESPLVLRKIIDAGVSCIVSKGDPLEHLLPALLAAGAGRTYQSPEIVARLKPQVPALSRRESEVLRMYAEGLSVLEIAGRTERSRKTVSTQKVAAMRKLGLSTDAEVFQYAIANGLVNASQVARAKANKTD